MRNVIAPQNPFFANISRSMRPRRKIVGVENVLREISHRIDFSRVSLHLPFDLKKNVFRKIRIKVRYLQKSRPERKKMKNLDFHLFQLMAF